MAYKTCEHCEFCTREYNTSNHYCLRMGGVRMIFGGPRPVAPNNTCKHFVLHNKFMERTR